MVENTVYTIGHSNHSIEYFIELLQAFSIDCVIDVRSVAGSSYNPQYNREALQRALKSYNIAYLFFGKEFGARHSSEELLDLEDGKVDYEKVRQTSHFKNGVERLKDGITKGHKIALMCSEADPFDCHRFSMISIFLEKSGINVRHILKDKTIVKNKELEKKLLKKYAKKIPQPSLFEPDISLENQIDYAYKLRNKDIAHVSSGKNLI